VKIGKVSLYGAAAVAVAAFGFALFKKWQSRIVGAPAVPYSSGTVGAGNGNAYFDENTA
jgi:hypothetical protein